MAIVPGASAFGGVEMQIRQDLRVGQKFLRADVLGQHLLEPEVLPEPIAVSVNLPVFAVAAVVLLDVDAPVPAPEPVAAVVSLNVDVPVPEPIAVAAVVLLDLDVPVPEPVAVAAVVLLDVDAPVSAPVNVLEPVAAVVPLHVEVPVLVAGLQPGRVVLPIDHFEECGLKGRLNPECLCLLALKISAA